MKHILCIFGLLLIISTVVFADGTWMDTTLVPPSLGFETQVRIYLPEGYDPGGTINYPVVYWLHGWWSNGQPGHNTYLEKKVALDSLISSGQIQPVLVVKPNGTCDPYNGSYWVNSELYGDYEDYVVYDLVAFIDSTFCTISDPEYRCIAGHCMGGCGSMRISLEHPDRYRASASHCGTHDMLVAMPPFVAAVLTECPESEPPYTYDWGNGFHTNALFLGSGAYSPNLSAPDSVDFILDENGAAIDSVYALWEQFNPAHMVKGLSPPIDLDIFFDCGEDDMLAGCYISNCSYSDTLTDLGIAHVFQNLPGVGHSMNLDRYIQAFLFLDAAMTGIVGTSGIATSVSLGSAYPNPFTSATSIRFDLPEATHVSLKVYDVSGRMVMSLADEELGVGQHSMILEKGDLVPGMYIFVLKAGVAVETESCVLLR